MYGDKFLEQEAKSIVSQVKDYISINFDNEDRKTVSAFFDFNGEKECIYIKFNAYHEFYIEFDNSYTEIELTINSIEVDGYVYESTGYRPLPNVTERLNYFLSKHS